MKRQRPVLSTAFVRVRLRLLTLILPFFILPLACNPAPDEPPKDIAIPTNLPTETAVPNIPTGTLVYVEQNNRSQELFKYDLVTEEKRTLFTVPPNGWLLQTDVSPDGVLMVMAYATPPPENEVQFGYFKLYLMPADSETEPRLLIEPGIPEEVFFNPVWGPDGRHIYYSHVIPNKDNPFDFVVVLERIELETGDVEALVDNGLWPQVSADGTRITYVFYDPEIRERSLYIADDDGSNPLLLTGSDLFDDIDAPLFSPDGEWIYFGAVIADQTSSLPWFDRLLGVRKAMAHDVPSDWWRISVTGGNPERVTAINAMGMVGNFSPDGRYFAFSSATGLYVMKPDGSELAQIVKTATSATLSWIP